MPKTSLTKKERVQRTTRFEETDRVPIYDILENDAIIEHYSEHRLTLEKGKWIKGLAVGGCLDMTRMPNGPQRAGKRRLANGILLQQERWTSWIVERPFKDRDSLVAWIKDEIARTERQQFGRAYNKQIHQEVQTCLVNFAAGCEPINGRPDPAVLILESGVGLTELYWWVGLETFIYLLADEPNLVDAWLEARNQAELRRVAAIADPNLIPIALTYDDIAYKNGLLFSPSWLRRIWIPRLKKLVDAWHQQDTLCLFHSDGNLWATLDDIVAAGIDGLNPMETIAGMRIGDVRQRYPDLFLTGGIDVSQLLCLGTPAEVQAACRDAFTEAGNTGYFLGSTTELHPAVRLENASAMFESAWKTAES